MAKKNVNIILLFLLLFCVSSCKKSEEVKPPEKVYTEQQEKTFSVFNGTFKQVFSYDFLEGLENTWIFKKRFDIPKKFYAETYMNGKELALTAHGECTYISYSGEEREFWYHIDESAGTMKTYTKREKYSERELYYHKYTLEIRDMDNFVLFYDSPLGAQIDKYKRVK